MLNMIYRDVKLKRAQKSLAEKKGLLVQNDDQNFLEFLCDSNYAKFQFRAFQRDLSMKTMAYVYIENLPLQ